MSTKDICVKQLENLLASCYKEALSEAIKAGIRRKRKLQAKQLNHD